MDNQPLTQQQLTDSSQRGEKNAAHALSVLSKREVTVETTEANLVSYADAISSVNNIEGHAVIAYMKILTGFDGASILSMERKDALELVDLFNNRPVGTTVAMQELDRSTIRETLNILSNAYATELAKEASLDVMLSVPQMITKESIEPMLGDAGVSNDKQAALFQTQLKIEEVDYKVKLFFFFVTK